MIRIDALWLCSQPQDMRAGAVRLLTVVVNIRLLGRADRPVASRRGAVQRQPGQSGQDRMLQQQAQALGSR